MNKSISKGNEEFQLNETNLKDKLLQKLIEKISVDTEFLLEIFNHNEVQIKKVVAEFETRKLATIAKVDQGIGITKLSKTDNADIFESNGGFYKEYIDKINKEAKIEEDRNLSNNAKKDQMRTNKLNRTGTIISICISTLALGISIIALLKH